MTTITLTGNLKIPDATRDHARAVARSIHTCLSARSQDVVCGKVTEICQVLETLGVSESDIQQLSDEMDAIMNNKQLGEDIRRAKTRRIEKAQKWAGRKTKETVR